MLLYIMLAYLMPLTGLFDAVCMILVYLFCFAIDFSIVIHTNAFCFYVFVFALLTHISFTSIFFSPYIILGVNITTGCCYGLAPC